MSLEMLIQVAIYCLKSSRNNMDEEQDECGKLQFLIEQLELIPRRHYSQVLCYMIHAYECCSIHRSTRREYALPAVRKYSLESL